MKEFNTKLLDSLSLTAQNESLSETKDALSKVLRRLPTERANRGLK